MYQICHHEKNGNFSDPTILKCDVKDQKQALLSNCHLVQIQF